MKKQINFPENFLWGAATSAHQVEGNNRNDWSRWEKSEKRIKFLESEGLAKKYGLENFISGRAADHYNRFRQDFDIAKFLRHSAHRFSIEWSRIEPAEGKFDEKEIEHYRQVLKALRERGIEPFVTLWHWTIPIWLQDMGGWQCKKTPDYFARYVEKISNALGDDIKFWITLNEPELYAGNSYFRAVWPPQKKNPLAYLRVLRNLIKAHRKAYRIIKKSNPSAQIGIAKNNVYFESAGGPVNYVLKNLADWWWNFYFLNQIKNHQDFIGLNYYFYNRVNYGFNKNENKKTSDMGWELYPKGIYFVLKDLARYQKPIYITENGLADAKDENRGWFIFETLKNVSQAIGEGVDVRGYFHWSFTDNFEWDKGFWPRFGLLEIDYKTMERKIRLSARFYGRISAANRITEDILNKHNIFIMT